MQETRVAHDTNTTLDSFKSDSVFGRVYSLPHGIEVICGSDDDHGISEVTSQATPHYQVSRGAHTIVLWNELTMINPLGDSKSFRKEKKRLNKHIASAFDATENGLFSIEFRQHEVKTDMANHCQITSYLPNFCKPIVFQPFAFFKAGARSGGAYFTFSSTLPLANQKAKNIKKIITGMCLRPNFVMITEKGGHADLVDMVYLNVPRFREKKIADFKKIDGVHPYETANLEMLKNLMPFFTTISQTTSPSLYFHLPLAEYLIHGISIFLAGNMTLETLDVYANLLISYASVLQQKLLEKLEDVVIHFSSPLEVLIQNIILSGGSKRSSFSKISV